MRDPRPIYRRPDFGEIRMLQNQSIALVSYIDDNHWYWVPVNGIKAPNVAPKREFISWNSLKRY